VGALAALGSLLVTEGTTAGALAGLWAAVCLCAAVAGATVASRRWRHALALPGLGALTLAAGLGYLAVGGAWLVVSRLDLHPFGLSTDLVRLTVVHFHFAAFGLPVLGAAALAAVDWLASRLALVSGCTTSVAGPPLVAAGFALDSSLLLVLGALVVTYAAWAVAFGTFLLATSTSALDLDTPGRRGGLPPGPVAPPRRPGRARAVGKALLVGSALSPIIPMLLAVEWAVARGTGLPSLSLHAMASTHGVLNGVGFVVAGMVGWLLVGVPLQRPAAPAVTGTG
jgi:hypothetical protein